MGLPIEELTPTQQNINIAKMNARLVEMGELNPYADCGGCGLMFDITDPAECEASELHDCVKSDDVPRDSNGKALC